MMLESDFQKAIKGLTFVHAEYFSSIGSTNDVVAEWAQEGVTGFCLAYADEQTRGRGREGRTWFTPPGSALAFSVLLNTKQSTEPNLLGLVSGLGALAVCEALENLFGLEPQIKWPNDVLLSGKKTCGVLAEAHWSGDQLQALVLGIGINVASSSVPSETELNFPAICIEEVLGQKAEPAKLLRSVLESLIVWKDKLNNPRFIEAWDKRLAFKSKHVWIEGTENAVEGKVFSLARDGRLQLKLENGEVLAFDFGEIRLRP
jgi:BirA family biotin operon repressor/biotin-[acetyl-CoA-carboxylase] ligase